MTITDINLEIRALCDTDSTGLTDATLLRRVNQAYEEAVGKIIGLDGSWEFDDTNFTNFPIGTQDLVEGQYDYSFDTSMLNILKVAVLHASDSKYHFLEPIDRSQMHEPIETAWQNNGLPAYYDKDGKSIWLAPPPSATDVTTTAGLKVYFQRTADIYTSAEVTTGTKEPGFASPYHMLLVYRAALPYCMTYKKDRVQMLQMMADKLEADMLKFYARREKDVPKVMRMKPISFR